VSLFQKPKVNLTTSRERAVPVSWLLIPLPVLQGST